MAGVASAPSPGPGNQWHNSEDTVVKLILTALEKALVPLSFRFPQLNKLKDFPLIQINPAMVTFNTESLKEIYKIIICEHCKDSNVLWSI